MRAFLESLKNLKRYPSAIVGLLIILILVGIALYAVLSAPYSEVIRRWRGGEEVWIENPRNALPKWVNLWPGKKLPETLVLKSQGKGKTVRTLGSGISEVEISLAFDYPYDDFPAEINVFFEAGYEKRQPYVSLSWRTPDGREVELGELSVSKDYRYSLSQDDRLQRRLGASPEVGLFTEPENKKLLKGHYELLIEGLLFEEQSFLDAKLVVYGKVYGLAGTDHRRRDLMVAIVWGTPIALAFGLLAAVGLTILTLCIAAIGAWYGGLVDAAIQRVTEVNLILPVLPILILVGTLYSHSIWVILGVLIALSIFRASIKVYRAMFLQVKESPYIEAAKAYGASNLRIVFRYMIPRVVPVLVPQFVILIPELIFIEASLAVLGLGDPVLPTWGKVLNDAFQEGALYNGYYYWVLEPSALLMLTGLGFAMLGFALDRIFNPRLREL